MTTPATRPVTRADGAPRRGPGRPRREDQRDTHEIVLRAATRLFAERGFDAVGVRDVAEAAGVNVATVHHHGGRKAELYDACFARIFAAERAAVESAVTPARAALDEGPEALAAALHDLVDAFVDFLEDRPETTALWLRRWLAPAEHGRLDTDYADPIYAEVEALLAAAHARGLLHEPTPHTAVRSLVWAVHGHVVTLAAVAPGQRDGDARARRETRAFVHRWVDAMYGAGAH
ncbi:TetR family transcriptional regulator [Sediminihabitans luteus]|uniref:TetR family transcriptional regulator n=1 Tax=Sediminihabitans luteus TaxID=1138585 RepID=A0A2M9D111_9CELL|nr:TetR family transcriptional regulator [Sediminihabitans luteus]